MEQKPTKFEKKLIDFLISHHDQKQVKGKSLVKETKRLSKSKNDIVSKITNSIDGFEMISEIIKISNITSNKLSDSENKEYIREQYSYLTKSIILSTLSFNLIEQQDNLEYFKNLQRELATEIFSLERLKKILESIFIFHPTGIMSEKISDHIRYYNSSKLDSKYYREDHMQYYHDAASVLVKLGIDEIKKNLHPDKDKLLIERLDFTVNMIQKLNYRVEKITD